MNHRSSRRFPTRSNVLAVVPAWVVALAGWASHDIGVVVLGLALCVVAPVFDLMIAGAGIAEPRRSTASLRERLSEVSLLLPLASFVILLVVTVPGACGGGEECF